MMCLPRLLDHPSFMSSLTLWFDVKHSRASRIYSNCICITMSCFYVKRNSHILEASCTCFIKPAVCEVFLSCAVMQRKRQNFLFRCCFKAPSSNTVKEQ